MKHMGGGRDIHWLTGRVAAHREKERGLLMKQERLKSGCGAPAWSMPLSVFIKRECAIVLFGVMTRINASRFVFDCTRMGFIWRWQSPKPTPWSSNIPNGRNGNRVWIKKVFLSEMRNWWSVWHDDWYGNVLYDLWITGKNRGGFVFAVTSNRIKKPIQSKVENTGRFHTDVKLKWPASIVGLFGIKALFYADEINKDPGNDALMQTQ